MHEAFNLGILNTTWYHGLVSLNTEHFKDRASSEPEQDPRKADSAQSIWEGVIFFCFNIHFWQNWLFSWPLLES